MTLLGNLSFLPRILEATDKNTKAVEDTKISFVDALTGKKQLSDDTFKILVRWIIAPIFFGLLILIVFLVVGNSKYTERAMNYKSKNFGSLNQVVPDSPVPNN